MVVPLSTALRLSLLCVIEQKPLQRLIGSNLRSVAVLASAKLFKMNILSLADRAAGDLCCVQQA
jgi:hypothetical protein